MKADTTGRPIWADPQAWSASLGTFFLSLAANYICLAYSFDWGTAPIWLGSGISLSFLSLYTRRYHRLIYPSIFLSNLLGNLLWFPLAPAPILFALINVAEPFLIMIWLRRLVNLKDVFDSLNATVKFLMVVTVGVLVSGFFGSLIAVRLDQHLDFHLQWCVWSMDDLLGIVTIFPLPFFLRSVGREFKSLRDWKRVLEGIFAYGLGGWLVFHLLPFAPKAFSFLYYLYWPFPLSLWMAIRFPRFLTWLVFSIGFIFSAITTRVGIGIFDVFGSDVLGGVFGMQLYALAIMIPCLLIQALLGEKANRLLEMESLYAEAERAKLDAMEANAAKSLFLANVSHELRTPLSSILGFVNIFDRRNLHDKQKEFLGKVERNANSLLYLVEDLLALVSGEGCGRRMVEGDVRLNDIVADVNAIWNQMPHSQEVDFRCDLETTAYNSFTSDYVRVNQVVSNLLRNAMKFTHEGTIVMSLSLEKSEMHPDHSGIFICAIRDSGIGIPAEKKETIFQPFVQVNEGMTRSYGGSGLGLYIAKKIANTLGGDVTLVESEPGVGSLFRAHFRVRSIH